MENPMKINTLNVAIALLMSATLLQAPNHLVLAQAPTPTATAAAPPQTEQAIVTEIVDGDTIGVTINGQPFRLRYIGIDSPEKGQPRVAAQCYSAEATEANSALVMSQTLTLERDKSNTDRYKRLLRYAYLPDGRMVNEVLVQIGAAFARRYPPDVKYQTRFAQAQAAAQVGAQGLWSGCKVVNGRTQSLPLVAPTLAPPAEPLPVAVIPPTATPVPPPAPAAPAASNCDPSYPSLCIPINSPDLDCPDISARRFPVLPPDPHRFDGDHDGIGCEK